MAKAIEQIGGINVGHAKLGLHGSGTGSIKQQTHDGDTVTVAALGNFGIRFLGIDAPEISFNLPGEQNFTSVGNEKWVTFFETIFDPKLPVFNPALSEGLTNYLKDKISNGADTSSNHFHHAKKAEESLEAMILKDMEEQGRNIDTFEFFLIFAFEVMDRYGRLLAFLNRRQDEEPRPASYNQRLVEMGRVAPYFIWPNISPFRKMPSIKDAVIKPGKANNIAENTPALKSARDGIKWAREKKIGIFERDNPLIIQAFELRFLARRQPPDRWVIDLGKSDNKLLSPQDYYKIENIEDRLFIPAEYVPLFAEEGWEKQEG